MEGLCRPGSCEGGLCRLLLGVRGAHWVEWSCRRPSIPVRPAKVREEQLTASRSGSNPHRYLHQTGHILYIHELFSSKKRRRVCVGGEVGNVCFQLCTFGQALFSAFGADFLFRGVVGVVRVLFPNRRLVYSSLG